MTAKLDHDTGSAGARPPEGRPEPDMGEAPLSAAESLALITQQRTVTQRALMVSTSYILWVWAAAWLIGYALMWAGAEGMLPVPNWLVGAFFGLIMVAGIVLTAIHIGIRSHGRRGRSQQVGIGYGLSWMLGFTAMATLGTALEKAGASDAVAQLYWSLSPALLVGLLNLVGALIYRDRAWFTAGALIVCSVVAASFAGPVDCLLVMSLAGGGSMLLCAIAAMLLDRRRGSPSPGRSIAAGG